MDFQTVNGMSVAENYAKAGTVEKENKKEIAKDYGKTVGQPKLSEKALDYYNSLKKKYGNMDFVLVSREEKENAKANAARYANPAKMVVLIDEDKIERMASDENYRAQYEAKISQASNKLPELQGQLMQSPAAASVKGFGMQVEDGGTVSFFAVLKKSSAEQKARIEAKREQKAEAKKAEKKKEEKEHVKERAEKRKEKLHAEKSDPKRLQDEEDEDEYITIRANSMDELLKQLDAYYQNERMNSVRTEEEQMLGTHIDFKG